MQHSELNPDFPKLTEAEAAIVAAALASASCKDGGEKAAQRHFLAHYRFLLEKKWPEPGREMSRGMNLK